MLVSARIIIRVRPQGAFGQRPVPLAWHHRWGERQASDGELR